LSNPLTKEKDKKVRVFALAKELNLESKVLLDYCKELGFAGITNQLNGLEPDQAVSLKERVKKGPKAGHAAPAHAAPHKPGIPANVPPIKVQTLPKTVAKPAAPPKPTLATPAAAVEPPAPVVEVTPPAVEPIPEAVAPEPTPTVVALTPPAPAAPAVPAVPRQNVIPNFAGSGGVRNLGGGGVRKPNAPPVRPVATPTAIAPATTPTVPPDTNPAPPTPPVAPPAAAIPPAAVIPPAATIPPPVADPTPPRPATPAPGPATTPPSVPPRPTYNSSGTSGGTIPSRPPMNGGAVPSAGGSGSTPRPAFKPPQVPPPRQGITAPPRTGGPPRPGYGPPQPGGLRPAGPGSAPPSGGGPRPGPGGPTGPARSTGTVRLTPEMMDRLRSASARGQKIDPKDLSRPQPGQAQPPGAPGGPPRPGGPTATPARAPLGSGPPRPGDSSGGGGEDDDDKKKGPGGVIGRDSRHKGRATPNRGRGPSTGQPAVVLGPGGRVDVIEQQWGSRRGPRAALLRKHMRGKQAPIIKEGRIEIAPPINVRSLSETIGMKAGELSKRLLKETGQLYGVNSTIDFNIASLIAVEKNIELVLKKQETAEEKLLREFEDASHTVDPEKLRPRPPIVTIMGHVDHGKTSLLDKIRTSKVVDTEVGGITQVIRAWSVTHKIEDPETGEKVIEKPITFLDTPGHEAFTKMRARGANVTDIAVIVVAATDGVMPQTEEAIAHARAADVRIIVAINKVDMPNANIDKTRRQLYGLNLLPDDMGGDTQFVETSAHTGQGIDDLLTAILLEAELNIADELQADPDRPATGTCLEAYMTGDEGVMATVIVQQGTLKRGDILLCGSTFGRVRAMYNDLGRSIQEAEPSTPVRVTGLNEVPNADDPFYVVEDLTIAQEVAEIRRQKDRETQLHKFAPVSLDSLTTARSKVKITELKLILKAEARGSVEAIRKEMEKLVHEEVTTRVLHAGIGAITEADVQLALTSPDDTLVIGFNVTADDPALRLAGEWGVSIREYQIIYKLVEDVKAALEGRLKPIEEVVHLGRAVVRATFKHGKVGTIAGCYVTSGTIERSARVRLIRDGVVAYPPAEKVVGLDSLKRFKDDAKDVREGFECGLKISGYDDIKVGDVIEAFKIEIRQRTL